MKQNFNYFINYKNLCLQLFLHRQITEFYMDGDTQSQYVLDFLIESAIET